MKIIYWSDFSCPFCYIGVTHLKKAIANLGLADTEIELKAFELDPRAGKEPVALAVSRYAAKYGIKEEQALAQIAEIEEIGREAGLEIHFAGTQNTNTLDAHRLVKLAMREGGAAMAGRVADRFYRAFFTDNLVLSDPDVLKAITAEEGLDADLVEQVLTSDQFTDEVRLDEREAKRYSIYTIPHFRIGDEIIIPGAMAVERLEEILKKARS